MGFFTYKEYIKDGKKVLKVNILPERYCTFDCIFCPCGRTSNKQETQTDFPGNDDAILELEKILDEKKNQIDIVFLNSKGEALLNKRVGDIIDLIKRKNKPIRLLSNGYLLGKDPYKKIAQKCDEVIGEVRVVTDKDFQKTHRPLLGYTFDEHISNMAEFKKEYSGTFILEINILKGYSDTDLAVEKLKEIINIIKPDIVKVEPMEDERFMKKYGIEEERLQKIKATLEKPPKC
ncbi:MAG: radical SAM protein [Clostridiaceae bacterium]|nr:radical SAM protein [Clostridiaceae bacterium]